MKKKSIRLIILGCLVLGIMSGCTTNKAKKWSNSLSSSSQSMTEEEKKKAHEQELEEQRKYDLENNKTASSESSSAKDSNIPDEIVIKDEGFITDLDKIFENIDLYKGKKIIIEGFVRNVNDKNFSVLRYYDMPHEDHSDEVTVGINVEYDGEMPKVDDWVEVRGIIEAEEFEGSKQPIIKASKVQKQFTWGQKKVTN